MRYAEHKLCTIDLHPTLFFVQSLYFNSYLTVIYVISRTRPGTASIACRRKARPASLVPRMTLVQSSPIIIMVRKGGWGRALPTIFNESKVE